MKFVDKAKSFIDDVIVEMRKVSWPTWEQLVNSSVVVIVISALFTFYIFVVDQIVSFVVKHLY
ncbi:MAG TPA: preprotein translocase subunit SecE [Calditrichae bacterium]|nr:preprotein translocase subunit SecE [Calditrichia bacterium]